MSIIDSSATLRYVDVIELVNENAITAPKANRVARTD